MKLCLQLLLVAPIVTSATVANNAEERAVEAAAFKFQEDDEITPIQQILKMMTNMKQKGIDMIKAEEIQFKTFATWCEDEKKVVSEEIGKGQSKRQELKAFVFLKGVEIRRFIKKIMDAKDDLMQIEEDIGDLKAIREKEKKDNAQAYKDTTETIAALDNAIAVLKAQDRTLAQETGEVVTPAPTLTESVRDPLEERTGFQLGFLQIQRWNSLPWEAKDAISVFLEQKRQLPVQRGPRGPPDGVKDYMKPEAHGYEFQSNNIVDMLQQMSDEFEEKLHELNRKESASRFNYDKGYQQLTRRHKEITRQKDRLTLLQTETEQEQARGQGDLNEATDKFHEDNQHLRETTDMCNQKKRDYDERTIMRKHEVEILGETIDIISSGDVKGTAKKYLNDFAQIRSQNQSTSLGQLRASQRNPRMEEVVMFLQGQAAAQDSHVLLQLAGQIMANPLKKVTKMVKDLMYQLIEEDKAEMEEKGYCDAELATNKQTRDLKTEAISKVDMDIEDLTAKLATLTDDIATWTADIAELKAAQANATAIRKESNKKAKETIFDAKVAQINVQNAISIVKNYYAKAKRSKVFAQVRKDPYLEQPEIFDESYHGMDDGKSGSLDDFLQVIYTDFVRLERDTATQEAKEVQIYGEYMYDTDKQLVTKGTQLKNKLSEKVDKGADLEQQQKERKGLQSQLDAAVEYYGKLKKQCLDTGISYEERKKKMDAEIVSLQEALKILEGQDIAVR